MCRTFPSNIKLMHRVTVPELLGLRYGGKKPDVWENLFLAFGVPLLKPRPFLLAGDIVELENGDSINLAWTGLMMELVRMQATFDGKETEENWKARSDKCQAIVKIANERNPPIQELVKNVRLLIDGILRCATSERTSLSNEACKAIQALAAALGPAIHPMLDIVLPPLIQLCGFTKGISQKTGNETVAAIVIHATYHHRLLHHVTTACEDKKTPPRVFAATWLNTIITQYTRSIEQPQTLDMLDKYITIGLNDAQLKVREDMRATYWAYAKTWPARADTILSGLASHASKALLDDVHNPKKPVKEKESAKKVSNIATMKAQALKKKQDEEAAAAATAAEQVTVAALTEVSEGTVEDQQPELTSLSVTLVPFEATQQSIQPQLTYHNDTDMGAQDLVEAQLPIRPTPALSLSSVQAGKQAVKFVATQDIQMELGEPSSSSRVRAMIAAPPHPDTPDTQASEPVPIATDRSLLSAAPVRRGRIIARPLNTSSQLGSSIAGPSRIRVLATPSNPPQASIPTAPSAVSTVVSQVTTTTTALPSEGSRALRPTQKKKRSGKARKIISDEELKDLMTKPLENQDDANKENNMSKIITDQRSWAKKEIVESNLKDISPIRKDPHEAREKLTQGIASIKAGTLDELGYRRLQGLIKEHDDIFQDEDAYDFMILALFDALEAPNLTASDTNTTNTLEGGRTTIHFRVLILIRLMMTHNRKYITAYLARAMTTLINARGNFESRTHIVSGIEKTAEDIVLATRRPTDIIDVVIDNLRFQNTDKAGVRSIALGLHVLAGLVDRVQALDITLPDYLEREMASTAMTFLRSRDMMIKRAAVAYCVHLHEIIAPEPRFYALVTANIDEIKDLIAYYVIAEESEQKTKGRGK